MFKFKTDEMIELAKSGDLDKVKDYLSVVLPNLAGNGEYEINSNTDEEFVWFVIGYLPPASRNELSSHLIDLSREYFDISPKLHPELPLDVILTVGWWRQTAFENYGWLDQYDIEFMKNYPVIRCDYTVVEGRTFSAFIGCMEALVD